MKEERERPSYIGSLDCYAGKWGRAEMEGGTCPSSSSWGEACGGSSRTQRDPKRHVKPADHNPPSPCDTGEVSWDPENNREEFAIGKNRMKLKLGRLSRRYQISAFLQL